MQPASTIEGWLEDVDEQGMHACERATAIAITANVELQLANPIRKRRGVSLPIVETRQKRQKQALELEPRAMDPAQSSRALRSSSRNRNREQASRYTASINNASTSSLVMLTSATTLSQSSVASGSKTTSRARSRSPAKTVHDLENADPPTIYLQMRHPGNEVPFTVQKLNNKVLRAARRGRGLLPGSIRSLLTPHLDDCDAEDDDLFYDGPTDGQVQDTFKAILRIYNNARKCFECDKPEASWGEEVVRPLLDLAASRTNGRATIENITSTNIQPPTLIPRGSSVEGLQYEGKRVDYGLFIEPTKDEIRKIKDRLKQLPDGEVWSINQTEGYYIREKPLLSSIELKKTRSNHDPLLQIAIWNSALFQRLEGLLDWTRKGDEMLPVPSVTVSGHTWQVCYSYIEKDGCSRMLRGMVDIGATDNIVGVYRTLGALEVITAYGVEEYWPWLSKYLLL